MVRFSSRLTTFFLVVALGALLLPTVSFAASTGQVKGTITDDETGEPVLGGSVLVVGTSMGAVTDLDGRFRILRLDPGTYTLRISHLEYNTVEVTEVVVKIDQTFEVNQRMTTKITDTDVTITVTGSRDILDKFVTDSRVVISQESIKTRPVQTVEALLDQVAGVQTSADGEIFIRGGRAGEVAYIVDGVPIGDPLGGGQVGANLSLASGSIAEIQIIKDGFDPEYGEALSGIVNIRSFTGDKDNTRVTLQYLTDDMGNSDLNRYSRNYDYLRMSLSGPDPLLANKVLPSLGLNFLKDKEFTYYLYADMDKNDGFYQMDDYDTPTTRREWSSFNFLGFNVPERMYNRFNLKANLKFRPRQNLKFVFSYKRWFEKETLFRRYYWEYRYSNNTAPIRVQDRKAISLEVTHSLSKDMNYEMIFSVVDTKNETQPGDPNHPGKTLSPDQFFKDSEWETYSDLNNNGVYDPPEPVLNVFPDTASYGTGFSGPAYTYGDGYIEVTEFGQVLVRPWRYPNTQGGIPITSNFRFNDNGYLDRLEGEPFLDYNNNGIWDQGDYLNDRNGNGILDNDRIPTVQTTAPEPYINGDSIIGEPFTDLNSNGFYDAGIDRFVMGVDDPNDPGANNDWNHNGRYDGPNDPWTPGVPYLDRNGNGVYDMPGPTYEPGDPFVDVNGNGKWDFGGTNQFLLPGSHASDLSWYESSVRTWRGEFKLTRQVGRHELKAGAHLQTDQVYTGEIESPQIQYNGRPDLANPYPDRGMFRDFYEYDPMRGSVYMRDKIEYGSMVASLGLRWDYFMQDTERLGDNLRADDRGGLVEGDRHKFSPRIGFSYPISDKAKVYFNYGHFFQLPQLRYMYRRNTSTADQNDVLGNPNLSYMKTIQYSFGVTYKMTESYALDVQGYFKDEFDKVNSGNVYEEYLTFQQYMNRDYGRSRGVELTLERRGGGYVDGEISYTYAFAFGKDSKSAEEFDRDLESNEALTESALNNDIRHTLKANVMIVMPSTVKPRLFGVPIPNGWALSFDVLVQSGKPFSPNSDFPGLAGSDTSPQSNSMRFPATATFDTRFSKDFAMAGLNWEFILWVENLFDTKNVVNLYLGNSAGTSTGRPDTQQNDPGPNGEPIISGGTDYDKNPYNWGYGRQIRFGLEVNI